MLRLRWQRLRPDAVLRLQLAPTDADLPPNTLTYRVVEGPPGLTVSATGLMEWTPPATLRPSNSRVVVQVSDGGIPNLSAGVEFRVLVASPPPAIDVSYVPATLTTPARIALRFITEAGWNYRIEAADILPPTKWDTVAAVSGDGGVAEFFDEVAFPVRFYRVVVE